VWLDANKNGVQDTGEAGISGVTVKLLNSSGRRCGHGHDGCQRQLPVQATWCRAATRFRSLRRRATSITGKDLGGNDALDSDIDPDSTGSTIAIDP
jgi:serine-aspartate repeat-containing protein C/D/E